ncbi:terminase small subunit [Dysgonomonas sp. BGC7]|uniref:terminase small subunit n=1 Tax=Dysgonomonas sp. BGC7 TaxID=1658008 RepID=UPI0006827EF0|nr:terminase small subunit [Dysgonomonas sp. BGC7]MBD8389651.1 terminase small subunit [Dysgonomonas sp. BGC7]
MLEKLTVKQEKFCDLYVEMGNASEAYRQAYSCDSMKPETINERSSRLLKEYKISTRIKQLQDNLRRKSDITKERILEELSAILNSRITDYLSFKNGRIKFKNFSDLSETQVKAIESIKKGKYGIELKLHGKSWTIERICKMLGYDMPEKREISGEISQLTIFELPDNGRNKNK